MFKFKERPYNLLLLTAVIVSTASFFVFNKAFDFHVRDTYFVVTLSYLFWAVCLLLLLFWTVYLLTKRLLFSVILTWAHVIATTSSLIIILIVSLLGTNSYNGLAGMPRRYYDYDSWNTFILYNYQAKGILIAFLLILVGQLAYVINLIIGIVKRLSRE